MQTDYSANRITDQERRDFLKALGITGAIGVAGEFTLGDLRETVADEPTDELAAMGRAIRADLTGTLDASLLAGELSALATEIERLAAVRAAGIPGREETLYGQLTDPAWNVERHLAEVGFFESAETNLPTFTPAHIASTTKELIRTESIAATLSELGFDEDEQTAMVMDVVNENQALAQWVPTRVYEDAELGVGEEYIDPETVAPLHRRAASGALLWIDGLDWHYWQNEVLLTDEILDAGLRDVKAMLGGFHLLSTAAEGLARGDISDEQLSALVTGSSAIMILNQLRLANDVARITDDVRAPRGGV